MKRRHLLRDIYHIGCTRDLVCFPVRFLAICATVHHSPALPTFELLCVFFTVRACMMHACRRWTGVSFETNRWWLNDLTALHYVINRYIWFFQDTSQNNLRITKFIVKWACPIWISICLPKMKSDMSGDLYSEFDCDSETCHNANEKK